MPRRKEALDEEMARDAAVYLIGENIAGGHSYSGESRGLHAGGDWLAPPESIIRARTWPGVIERLTEIHGEKAKVAVVPDATM